MHTQANISENTLQEFFNKTQETRKYFSTIFLENIEPFFVRKIPAWKRALDFFGSLVGMILFLPLFFVIAVLIKIVNPGPIFFKQERIGYKGRKFQFIKFRTMKVGCDSTEHRRHLACLINEDGDTEIPMIKLDDCDANIIPTGRLLRKLYIDELPQLINVLRGDMSLVGPRPPIPYEVEEYVGWHNDRFNAVPGMTGLWQVSGKNKLTFKEMVRLDIQYSRQLSFLLDLKILIKTPFAIISELMDHRQMIQQSN
jgi:lipopolysaccharide/colanic/teichoic acid biosynthesis glycosyltransferase